MVLKIHPFSAIQRVSIRPHSTVSPNGLNKNMPKSLIVDTCNSMCNNRIFSCLVKCQFGEITFKQFDTQPFN